jgi:hypothetical protein
MSKRLSKDYIEEMILLANQEYEKTMENMELANEKKILQLKTIHEMSKYDNVTNYLKVLFDEKTVLASKDSREKLQQFPIFPDGFITMLQCEEEKHNQLLHDEENALLEKIHKLQLKYSTIIIQLNECKKNQLASNTWFSVFENDQIPEEEVELITKSIRYIKNEL